MDTLITRSKINPEGTSYIHAEAGKVRAIVTAYRKSSVTVCCINAACRIGAGKTFHGPAAFDNALAAYKSPEMKAIIEAARDLFGGNICFDHTPSNIIPFKAS